MTRHRGALAAVAVLAAGALITTVAVAEPVRAASPAPFTVTLSNGWVGVRVAATPGAQVALDEQVTGRLVPLDTTTVPASGTLAVPHLTPWLCSRRTRTFVLRTLTSPYAPAASATVTTRSCAFRLALRTPSNVTAGRSAPVTVTDTWDAGGIAFTLCLTPPAAERTCRVVSLRAGRSSDRVSVGFESVGRWSVSVTTRYGQRLLRSVRAPHPRGRIVLLATGDSEIQEVDSDLAAALAPAHVDVSTDARVGSGISKVSLFDWVRHAADQAAQLQPDVTVVFIGANDGFALQTPAGVWVPCCRSAWIALFAARAERMMASYLQDGRGRVFWFTLPVARDPSFQAVFAAVNRAYIIAAAAFPGAVQLIRADRIFAPGGRFTPALDVDGRQVVVRAPDGIHLSPAGAQIAAAAVLSELRASQILG